MRGKNKCFPFISPFLLRVLGSIPPCPSVLMPSLFSLLPLSLSLVGAYVKTGQFSTNKRLLLCQVSFFRAVVVVVIVFLVGEWCKACCAGRRFFIGLLMSLPPGGRLCRPTALHMFVCSVLRTVRP